MIDRHVSAKTAVTVGLLAVVAAKKSRKHVEPAGSMSGRLPVTRSL